VGLVTFPIERRNDLLRKIARGLAEEARRIITPAISGPEGRILARAIRIVDGAGPDRVRRAGEVGLYIPHYWAVYAHDDRKAFGPRYAKILVWFPNPINDPRLQGNENVRFSDVVRLTSEEFYDGLSRGPSFMRIARNVPARPGRFFFTKGAAPFVEGAAKDAIAFNIFHEFAKKIAAQTSETKATKVVLG